VWVVFALINVLLLLGYIRDQLIGEHERKLLDPVLFKGLFPLEHYLVHFVTGIFFGLLVLVIYTYITKRRLLEPAVLLFTLLWSHAPDIRFLWRQLPHQNWEIIFFFHTIVDDYFISFWILLFLSLFLAYIYIRKVRSMSFF